MNCQHGNGNCRNTATVAARICVPATGWPIDMHEPLKALLSIQLCDRHFKDLNTKDFLDPTLEKSLRGIFDILARDAVKPDYDRAWFEKVKLDSDEYRMFQKFKSETGNCSG